MNTVLVRYGHSVRTKRTIYKKLEHKTHSESRDINENNIVQWLGETFRIFHQLAAEWCQIALIILFMTS